MRALILALAVVVSASTVAPSAVAQRPNIIFIMSDDHAAHAIGAYGSRVNETPNLDRLAREGAMLRNVFATNSICAPSRAVILTGQYSHLNGVTMFNRFDSSRPTVARALQRGGYYTGMIGKWHLGSDPVGFDHWEILPGQGAYMNPVLYSATGEKAYAGRYVTDLITDLALDFIKDRPRNKPFFLMLHHKAPHRAWEPRFRAPCRVRPAMDPRTSDVLGLLRHADGRAPRKPAARGDRSHARRSQASATARSRRREPNEVAGNRARQRDDHAQRHDRYADR